MDKETKKLIEELLTVSKELLQEFISTLNNLMSDEEQYQQVVNKWFELKTKLEKIGLKVAIKNFEFTYSVYKQRIATKQIKQTKKLSLTELDNKLLKSLKIIPPDEEKNKK